MPPRARGIGQLFMLLGMSVSPAWAQENLRVHADALFYGDNTEFRNPFREGETIFGSAARLCAAVDLNDRVTLTGGLYARQRFGDADAFDQIRPVVSLTVRGDRSAFLIGTLRFPARSSDDQTLHGLLPPLQRETLYFERSYENGLLWTFGSDRIRHSSWLAWQRLNTAEHRERLDAGAVTVVRLSEHVTLPAQAHIVHEGGQLHASGAVSDSYAGAAGLTVHAPGARLGRATLEGFVLASRHVPDRENPDRSRTGGAVLTRATAARDGWRAHILFWRGRHFVKDEGDPNYLSLRRDGRYYGGTRDYAEAGLARSWSPAPEVAVEASVRLHRVERHYAYSFRIVGRAAIDWRR